MKNGEIRLDTRGEVLHAHGGHIIRAGDFYYWYGQDIRGGAYVSCYRSRDLRSWEFRRIVLHSSSPVEPLPQSEYTNLKRKYTNRRVNIERPKVVYCEKTKKYVMWAHYENGRNYKCACACVSVCDTPDGDFTYCGAFRPMGNMSRDCTLFKDGDNVYFISASNDNRDLKVYLLSEDCLSIRSEAATLFAGQTREAPALFCRDGTYYMITSACTGWTPNQCKYAVAESVTGPWSQLRDIGDETAFFSQPACVLEKDGDFIYVGDRWGGNGKKLLKSTYVILPLTVDGDTLTLGYSPESAF